LEYHDLHGNLLQHRFDPRRRNRVVRFSIPSISHVVRFGLAPVVLMIVQAGAAPAIGQSTGWTQLTESDGVEISFIVHRYGDGRNAGVVIKLANRNTSEASYRFRVMIRSDQRQWTSEAVEGVLDPLEVRTGELSGLWWIPFKDGAPVTEVGLKGLRIHISNSDEARNETGKTS
jgi:hypothetical protein